MSLMLMAQSMRVKVGNPLRKLVLVKLADNANEEGEAYPSFQYIADQCEISRRSVVNHIEELEKMGLLTVETREGRYKRNSSNLYLLNVQEIERLSKANDRSRRPTSAGDSTTSAGDSPSTSAGAAPRIIHSSESVNESNICASFELFWSAGMRKLNKKGALKAFQSSCKRLKADPQEFAQKLADDVRARVRSGQLGFDAMHPTTYLNNERWEDEVLKPVEKPAFSADSDRWWSSDAGIQRKAAQEGVYSRPGESYRDLADRIRVMESKGVLRSQQPKQEPVEDLLKDQDIPF